MKLVTKEERIEDIHFTDLGKLFIPLSVLSNHIAFHIEFGRIELADSFLEEIISSAAEAGVNLGDRVDRIRIAMHKKMYEFSIDNARQYFEYGVKPLAMAWLDDAREYAGLSGIDDKMAGVMQQYYERIDG